MFRHKTSPVEQKEEKKDALTEEKSEAKTAQIKTVKDATPEALRDLLEKNLKWSQIIYEQNRRINNKLTWAVLASWIKLLIILIPLVFAIWFLPPYVKRALEQYNQLFDGTKGNMSQDEMGGSLDKLLKLLPLDPAQEQQLRAILK